ncbi:MAG: hypothetical protein ACI4S9_04815 [Christensenellales bacterium]
MKNYNYDVTLETELGNRKGTMRLKIEDKKIDGCLSLLNNSVPFYGTAASDGTCTLHGKIVTAKRVIVYDAAGRIDDNGIVLTLESGEHTFYMKGIAQSGD